jgi:hypothetical protein
MGRSPLDVQRQMGHTTDCRIGKGSKALFSTVLVKNIIARPYHSPTPDLTQVDPAVYSRYSLL